MGSYQTRERQKRREYKRMIERQRVWEAERIKTMEMLLGAEWDRDAKLFVQRGFLVKRGIPWVCFYDMQGNTLPTSKAIRRLSK
jgi:hypothetical protein